MVDRRKRYHDLMAAPPARSRANDISRLLNSRGFAEHITCPPTSQNGTIMVTITRGYARAAADILSRHGYTVRDGGIDDERPECIRVLVSSTRRIPGAPTSTHSADGTWVPVTASDAKAMNLFIWQKCSFTVNTFVDRETGRVVTSFPTGWRSGMEYFMQTHRYRGTIESGHVPSVSRVVWDARFVPS